MPTNLSEQFQNSKISFYNFFPKHYSLVSCIMQITNIQSIITKKDYYVYNTAIPLAHVFSLFPLIFCPY